jgi:hypothetical protein
MFGDSETWLARPFDKKIQSLIIIIAESADQNFNELLHQQEMRPTWNSRVVYVNNKQHGCTAYLSQLM